MPAVVVSSNTTGLAAKVRDCGRWLGMQPWRAGAVGFSEIYWASVCRSGAPREDRLARRSRGHRGDRRAQGAAYSQSGTL